MRIVQDKKNDEWQRSDDEVDPQPLDPEAVSRLFQEHNRRLVDYLTVRLRSENEAREVAQESYVRLLRLHKQGTPSLFCAWLFKTATRLAIDRLRRRSFRSREVQVFGDLTHASPPAVSPEQAAIAEEQTRQVLQFVSELPRKYQEVFDLCCVKEIGQKDVARKLDLSARMVRRYVAYTLAYCRLRIDGSSTAHACRELTL